MTVCCVYSAAHDLLSQHTTFTAEKACLRMRRITDSLHFSTWLIPVFHASAF